MTRRRGKTLSADTRDQTTSADADAEHFAREMSDVVRLAPDPRGRVRTRPTLSKLHVPTASTSSNEQDPDDIRRATSSRLRSTSARHAVAQRAEAAGSPSDEAFVKPGVDRRELRKLKRGEHVPGSHLDLHGMTAAEAVARLTRFIDAARHRCRCVCIVHGRGLHSVGNVAILRTRVRESLRQHPAVLAYSDAPRADGGSGAVYVLLRKHAGR